MRLIESFPSEGTIEIDGVSQSSYCLLEDRDTIRVGVVEDLGGIPIHIWTRVHSGGARYLVAPDEEGWRAVLTDRFLRDKVDTSFSMGIGGGWVHFSYFPSYRDLYEVVREKPKTQFVHLHAHSEFSVLDGLSKIDEMVDAVVADGQSALAVTDHGVCAGHPTLQKKAKEADIKPIFGIEANFVDDRHRQEKEVLYAYNHLVMWAETSDGLRNLWAMSTEAYREGFYGRPRMDWDTLSRFSEGVMASTACLRGPLSKHLLEEDEDAAKVTLGKLLGIFGDRLYLELHTTEGPEQEMVNYSLAILAQECSLPLIAVVDSHYPRLEDQMTHRVWIASQTNRADSDLFTGESSYHLMSAEEVRKALSYLPDSLVDEAIANTVLVSDRTGAVIEGKTTPPVFSKAPTYEEAKDKDVERLLKLCISNWEKKCLRESFSQEDYEARFEREMRLLIDKGFCGYFNMVSDYVRWARGQGILVGPGRGSGSGSLVSYLAEITGIDPVETGLMFERFLTEGRMALPDFDVDFPTSKRQEITDYIVNKYGEENVVRVGTQIRLKNKGVIRDVARILGGVDYKDLEAISKLIEEAEADKAGLGMSWEDLWTENEEVLIPYREKYPDLFTYAEKMVGRIKTFGKHPAGVVIAPDAQLTRRLPLRRASAKDKELVAEFDMDSLDELGFVKFDFLTVSTLDKIQQTVDRIKEDLGKVIDPNEWRGEYLDPMVWDEISSGHTLGIFQIETPGGTRDTKELRPQNLDQLADLLTLVRPGPKRSGLTASYLRRKDGVEPVSVIDPRLEPILESTYGCFSYETPVVIKQGVRSIGDLVGMQTLMTERGKWIESEVRSFGVQPLMKVVLQRNKQERVVYATPEHRWFAKWHDKSSGFTEKLTSDLKVGMVLKPQKAHRGKRITPSPFGIAHGIVFGDGTRDRFQSRVDLHGGKNQELLCYFPKSRMVSPNDQDRYSEPYVRVLDLPRLWKDAPRLDEGASYLYGWLAGYFAADGCVTKEGQPKMVSASRGDLEMFRTVGHLVGVTCYDITERKVKNNCLPNGRETGPRVYYEMGLVSSTVRSEFFLLSHHRQRFEEAEGGRQRNDWVQWQVVSVEETDRVEEVFCAVVPDIHSFVLEGNILTGNCMIYQEQVLKICMVLAGYNETEADDVRKILGKKKVELVESAGKEFISRAVANDTDQRVAETIWSQMAEFARYSFNRSHAYGYAVLGYWCAWPKFHYSSQFLAASMSTVDKHRIPDFIREARRMGFSLLPPDINLSGRGFKAMGSEIRYGFDGVKGVGDAVVDAIIVGQPYLSFEDFLERKGPKANAGIIKTLARVGGFDSLVPNRKALEESLDWEAEGLGEWCVWKDEKVKIDNDLPCTFNWASEPVVIGKRGLPLKQKPLPKRCTKACRNYTPPERPDFEEVGWYSPEEIMEREIEMLGIYLSFSPFDRLPEDIFQIEVAEGITVVPGSVVEEGSEGYEFVTVGLINKVRPHVAKDGKKMGFFSVNAVDVELDITAFSDEWEKHYLDLRIGNLCFVHLKKGGRGLTLIAMQVT